MGDQSAPLAAAILAAVVGIAALAALVGARSRVRELEAALDETMRRLLAVGVTDDLTGLSSRAAFEQSIEAEVARAERTGGKFAVLRADVRGLSQLDGAASDGTLKWFAHVLARQTRAIDSRARLGGDSFGVILVGADSHTATKVVQRIATAAPPNGVVTVFGVATYPDDGDGSGTLLRRAQEELELVG